MDSILMRYADYRDSIRDALRRNAGGLTWVELRAKLDLPYDRPCPEWTKRLEAEIGLTRVKGAGRALVWKAPGPKGKTATVGRIITLMLGVMFVVGCGNRTTSPIAAPATMPMARVEQTGPTTGGEYYVAGHVEKPGAFVLRTPVTLREALRKAGIQKSPGEAKLVLLVRHSTAFGEDRYEIGAVTVFESSVGDVLLQVDDQLHSGASAMTECWGKPRRSVRIP